MLLLSSARVTQSDLGSRVDAYIGKQMMERKIPGLSIEVVASGKVLFQKGYGFANLELQTPSSQTTVYRLMSVGKQFTATAVLLLSQRGRLKLDSPVGSYVGHLPASWGTVTLRQLLTHTSGIPDYVSAPGWNNTIALYREPLELLRPVMSRPLEFAPGCRFRYSNSNYFLLGLAIEAASGEKWSDFLTEEIFRPLGMRHTYAQDGARLIPHRASGYHLSKEGIINAPTVDASQIWAAGSVLSDVEDLGIWDEAMSSQKLLPKPVIDSMLSAPRLSSGEMAPYGFGNELENDHGHREAGHQGSGIGFNATYLRFPDDKLAVIVLTNLSQGGSREIARSIASFLIPAISDQGKQAIIDDNPKLSSKLRIFVEHAALGRVDEGLIAKKAQSELAPFVGKAGPQFLGPLGAVESFELLKVNPGGGGSTRRYRVRFDKRTIIFVFTIDSDGKIVAIEPTPDSD
jgi:CubicO group peptidase (beta-lactamase class C family)